MTSRTVGAESAAKVAVTQFLGRQFLGATVEKSFFCAPSDREEIVNLIRRQKQIHLPHEYSGIYI